MNDEYYMNLAINEAKKALLKKEVPVGAILVKNNKVIARGFNLKETKKNVISHAEIICIEKASKKINNWRLNDCTLYVTMFPCPMCASAINQARISKLVYGTIPEYADYNNVVNILNNNKYGNNVEIVGGILKEKSTLLLQKFFCEKR